MITDGMVWIVSIYRADRHICLLPLRVSNSLSPPLDMSGFLEYNENGWLGFKHPRKWKLQIKVEFTKNEDLDQGY